MRAAGWIVALAGALLLALLVVVAPMAAADGWRAAFLLLAAAPIGAVALLLIARIVGTDWDAALLPLLPAVPWLALLAVPVVLGQALFHWPRDHLHLWLSPPAFALRSALALGFWTWTARALARDAVTRPGALLFAHGFAVSVMGYDWLLGAAPAQPQSAAGMVLAVMQIGGACALACATGSGTGAQRRDLGHLLLSCALGLAYLLYMNFAIVWFGNLPEHVGWFADRYVLPASLLPGLALIVGLVAPILLIGLGGEDRHRRHAGVAALCALAVIACWQVAGPGGWWAIAALIAATVAVGGILRGATA